jgi:hypothetical protein
MLNRQQPVLIGDNFVNAIADLVVIHLGGASFESNFTWAEDQPILQSMSETPLNVAGKFVLGDGFLDDNSNSGWINSTTFDDAHFYLKEDGTLGVGEI